MAPYFKFTNLSSSLNLFEKIVFENTSEHFGA